MTYIYIYRERERGRERETYRQTDRPIERERERCEMMKTERWYYLHNMRSAYFPINRR